MKDYMAYSFYYRHTYLKAGVTACLLTISTIPNKITIKQIITRPIARLNQKKLIG